MVLYIISIYLISFLYCKKYSNTSLYPMMYKYINNDEIIGNWLETKPKKSREDILLLVDEVHQKKYKKGNLVLTIKVPRNWFCKQNQWQLYSCCKITACKKAAAANKPDLLYNLQLMHCSSWPLVYCIFQNMSQKVSPLFLYFVYQGENR